MQKANLYHNFDKLDHQMGYDKWSRNVRESENRSVSGTTGPASALNKRSCEAYSDLSMRKASSFVVGSRRKEASASRNARLENTLPDA